MRITARKNTTQIFYEEKVKKFSLQVNFFVMYRGSLNRAIADKLSRLTSLLNHVIHQSYSPAAKF